MDSVASTKPYKLPSNLRPYHSEGSIASPQTPKTRLTNVQFASPRIESKYKSEPSLSCKSHPLLDTLNDCTPHTYNELILAAEILENIVNEGTFVGSIRSRYKMFGKTHEPEHAGREMSDRVLKLVYGTMKFLPYVDHILVKTQFLVFNNQFLDSIGLIKVLLYDLMKYHFDYTKYPGIQYTLPSSTNPADTLYQTYTSTTVKEMDEALCSFQIKLSASYARLRIEKRASGDTSREQMENILPLDVREREMMAVDMPKTLRVNTLKISKELVGHMLEEEGYHVCLKSYSEIPDNVHKNNKGNLICLDDEMDNLFLIPPNLFADIKAGPLVNNGFLIFQDKASVYGMQHLCSLVSEGDQIIDARAGCGIKAASLSTLAGKSGTVFAFENRPGRLETLKSNTKLFGCSNVSIIEGDFGLCDTQDPRFSNVTIVVLEPPNSGTLIIDKLGFMLQEEEFPTDQYSQKDLYSLKRQQIVLLKHAFKFPKVRVVMYISRSQHSEENEEVVNEILDRYGVDWELSCVLPSITVEKIHDYEIDDCLTVRPSEQAGNGIFVACFQKKAVQVVEETPNDEIDNTCRLSELSIGDEHMHNRDSRSSIAATKEKKKRKNALGHNRKIRVTANIKLPKALSESVARLSMPRLFQLEQKKQRYEQLVQKKQLYDFGKNNLESAIGNSDETINDELENRNELESGQSKRIQTGSRGYLFDQQYNDISVFGMSLSKFYGPRMEAIKKLQAVANDGHWSYPIPNPRPWK
ncbi:hypothetical protein BDV3_000619 [Batrachochytrium dendrobatidis]|uniref:SAM-dependent MTase RsmB/NOP-type domain-containing protein n=1 Tax=Batrachochytrium dendrobatidis (strain JEL423) TaxID=403673 RepID=A0A177W8G4_BATDL|nr:hypothetical protein BDEG_20176 [Batrachochytrium dendrobatidis JEL423]